MSAPHATAAQWTSLNPLLGRGVIVYTRDTNELKVGNGVDRWVDLDPIGQNGADGADGVGVPVGGTTGQVLAKTSATDFATGWIDPPEGGGGGGLTSPQILARTLGA